MRIFNELRWPLSKATETLPQGTFPPSLVRIWKIFFELSRAQGRVTDGRTDRRTDGRTDPERSRVAIATKKGNWIPLVLYNTFALSIFKLSLQVRSTTAPNLIVTLLVKINQSPILTSLTRIYVKFSDFEWLLTFNDLSCEVWSLPC